MLKRISRKLDAVLSLKLREDLYTLAQMRENSLIQFFDIRSADGQWSGVDLSSVEPLFCAYVAESRMKPIIHEIVKTGIVKPNRRPTPRVMLSATPILDAKYKCTVDLIELGDDYEGLGATILKETLTPANDSQDLCRYELDGMLGSPDKLAKRLIRYFDTGVNWDDSKSFIFGDDLSPPPSKR